MEARNTQDCPATDRRKGRGDHARWVEGRTADGACPGLTVQVNAPGVPSRLFRYTAADGRRPEMGLGRVAVPGTVGGVSLAEARQAAEAARAASAAVPTRGLPSGRLEPGRQHGPPGCPPRWLLGFEKPAWDYVAAHEAERADKHRAESVSTLTQHAFLIIGARPVESISTDDVLAVLGPIGGRTSETASRLRGRIEAVLDAAKAGGFGAPWCPTASVPPSRSGHEKPTGLTTFPNSRWRTRIRTRCLRRTHGRKA